VTLAQDPVPAFNSSAPAALNAPTVAPPPATTQRPGEAAREACTNAREECLREGVSIVQCIKGMVSLTLRAVEFDFYALHTTGSLKSWT